MKEIGFSPNARIDVRAIDQQTQWASSPVSTVTLRPDMATSKPSKGDFDGLLQLRVGNYRVLFDETPEAINVHRVRDRREAYR